MNFSNEWLLKVSALGIALWFIFLFSQFIENGRYQFQAFGTNENDIVILDTRRGILFRLNDKFEWISSYAVEGAERTWQRAKVQADVISALSAQNKNK